MFNARFTFHAVGQGLFYSGRIKRDSNPNPNPLEFNFAYDCGTIDASRILKNAIDQYVQTLPTDGLDILILSHFHIDHISGLDRLLNYHNVNIKKCFIPYFTPEERFSFWAYAIYKGINYDEWYGDFLIDPVGYLLNKRVEQVIIIGKGPDNENKDFTPPKFSDDRDSKKEKIEVYLDNLEKDEKLINKIKDSEGEKRWEEWKNFKDRLLIKTDNGYIAISCGWYFRFFNLKNNLDHNIWNLKNCLASHDINITASWNGSIISQNMKIIKNCYREAFRNKELNITSLMTYHAPTERMSRVICYTSRYVIRIRNISTYSCFLRDITGQLLSGDAELGIVNVDNINQFEQHYRDVLGNVFLYQLPHHGSENNWKSSFMDLMPNCYIWVASSGLQSKFSHPSGTVIKSICKQGRVPICVNQNNEFTVDFHFPLF